MKNYSYECSRNEKQLLEKVETLSEEQLIALNQFVDRINNIPVKEYDLLSSVDGIVSEREEVLKKLAR